jgi:hypothetical protein
MYWTNYREDRLVLPDDPRISLRELLDIRYDVRSFSERYARFERDALEHFNKLAALGIATKDELEDLSTNFQSIRDLILETTAQAHRIYGNGARS